MTTLRSYNGFLTLITLFISEIPANPQMIGRRLGRTDQCGGVVTGGGKRATASS